MNREVDEIVWSKNKYTGVYAKKIGNKAFVKETEVEKCGGGKKYGNSKSYSKQRYSYSWPCP